MPSTGKEAIFYVGVKAVIKNPKGQILLLKTNPEDWHDKRPSFWELPGGRINNGDDYQKALKREVVEETGIRGLKIIKFLDAFITKAKSPFKDTTAGLALFVYLCEIKTEKKIKLSVEHLEYGWFSPKQASKILKSNFYKTTSPLIGKL